MYKTNYTPNGEIKHFKARLVAKRYKQKPKIDYFEIFALVADWVPHIDYFSCRSESFENISNRCQVKSVFLNCVLEEEVYSE